MHYEDLYPGIDLVLRSSERGLKYDLYLEPGADLSRVVFRCEGLDALRRDDTGLVLETAIGPMIQPVGRSFECLPDGTRRPIEVGYRLIEGNCFGFEAASRDQSLPLVIDPELTWST